MASTVSRLAGRFMWARKLRSLLSLLSVALGVGLLAAMITLNASMERALDEQMAQLYGRFDLMIGYRKANTRLSAAELSEIAQKPGVAEVAGILIPYMYESHPGLLRDLTYYGVPDTPLGREFFTLQAGTFPRAGEVVVSATWAKREGLALGDEVRLAFPPHEGQTVRVSGLAAVDSGIGMGLAFFERSWLEEVTGRPGGTFALIVTAKGTERSLLVSGLQTSFPDLEYDIRNQLDEQRQNLSAFRPIALGMGLATLVACAFLLSASFQISLAERKRELALMRAIGATPAQLRRLILVEGTLLGLLGSLLGAGLGVGAALLANGATARMLAVTAAPAAIPLGQVGVGALAGLALALLSARRVAQAAGASEPLQALRPDLQAQEEGAKQGGRFGLGLIGVGLVGVGLIPFLHQRGGDGSLPALVGSTGSLAIALGLLLGLQRLLPWLLPPLAAPFLHRPTGPLAVRSLLRHRRRSSLTVGALGMGLILVIAVSTFSSSLLERWYVDARKEHPTDIQLIVPRVYHQGVSADLAQVVAGVDGITQVATVGEEFYGLPLNPDWSKGVRIPSLSAADLPALVAIGAYRVVAGSLDDWSPGALAVQRAKADAEGLKVGDRLRLDVDPDRRWLAPERQQQVVEYRVTAIIESDSWRLPRFVTAAPPLGGSDKLRQVYANATPEKLAAARQQVRGLTGQMGFSLAEYSDVETAIAQLRTWTGQRLALLVAVGVIMAAVATMSLVGAIVNSVNERKREFALLRAVGATPEQVRSTVLLEAGLLGGVGGLVGTAGGAILGAGALWGLGLPLAEVRLPWVVMVAGLILSVLLALLAAIGSARQVLRLPPAAAVRQE